MKLLIDAREAYRPNKAGKAQWTAGFLRELRSRDVELTVLADTDCTEDGVITFPKGISWHIRATSFAKRQQPDAYVSPTSYIVPHLLSRHVACATVIHDLIAFQDEPHNGKAKWIERLLLARVVRDSKLLFTVSESTKRDLLARFPWVSPSYVTPIFAGPMHKSVEPNAPDNATILCVGTLCPRKNQERLIRAYATLPEHVRNRYVLKLVGSRGWDDAEILRLVRITEGVEWLDYVSDDVYAQLLRTATVFAYPSLYEGFGMQVLDALQRGIPVLTSDRGSLKEVAGSSAVIVNPEDERSIASGLIAILEHADVRSKLASEGPIQAENFSWKRTVDLFLESLESALY